MHFHSKWIGRNRRWTRRARLYRLRWWLLRFITVTKCHNGGFATSSLSISSISGITLGYQIKSTQMATFISVLSLSRLTSWTNSQSVASRTWDRVEEWHLSPQRIRLVWKNYPLSFVASTRVVVCLLLLYFAFACLQFNQQQQLFAVQSIVTVLLSWSSHGFISITICE